MEISISYTRKHIWFEYLLACSSTILRTCTSFMLKEPFSANLNIHMNLKNISCFYHKVNNCTVIYFMVFTHYMILKDKIGFFQFSLYTCYIQMTSWKHSIFIQYERFFLFPSRIRIRIFVKPGFGSRLHIQIQNPAKINPSYITQP